MGASAHVGRKGALALSLGIGFAVAGMATATAAPGEQATPAGKTHPNAADTATAKPDSGPANAAAAASILSGDARKSVGARTTAEQPSSRPTRATTAAHNSPTATTERASLVMEQVSVTTLALNDQATAPDVSTPAPTALSFTALATARRELEAAQFGAVALQPATAQQAQTLTATTIPTMTAIDTTPAAPSGTTTDTSAESLLDWTALATAGTLVYNSRSGSAVVASPAAAVANPAAATSSLAQFIANTTGKTIANPDGSYAGQCVSLVRQYLEQVYGVRTGAWGNAINYADGMGSGATNLKANGFSWHTDQNFQDGDIVVWDGYSNQGSGLQQFGHIGIYNSGRIFDQNDARHNPANRANYSGKFWYSNGTLGVTDGSTKYLGYWRKGTSTGGLSDGTYIGVSGGDGSVYRIAGGAPIYVSKWDNVGGAQPVTTVSQTQFDKLRTVPADGTYISAITRSEVYVIAGGAPLYVSKWENVGGAKSVIGVDVAAIDNAGGGGKWGHLNYKPADGTYIAGSPRGEVYVIAGGAPLYVSNFDNVGGGKQVTVVDVAAIDNAGGGGRWSHLNYTPADGTYLRGFTTGKVYSVSGGTPTLVTSTPGAYVNIDQSAIDSAGAGGVWNHLNALVRPNQAPVIARVEVATPNVSTGVVTGSVTATDPDGNTLTYSAPASTSKGGVTVNASTGTFTYTPTATARQNAASGSAADKQDSFTVTVTDTSGATANAAVTVGVAAPAAKPNQAPVVTAVEVAEPNDLTGIVLGYVTGSDPDNNELTYSAPSSTGKGAVNINISAGTFTYTPTAAARHAVLTQGTQTATDAFTLTISDGHGGSVQAPVTVTISPNNSAPTATAAAGTPDPSTGVVIGTITGSDPDDDAMTISTPSSTGKGTVRLNDDGTFTYTPTTAARQKAATGSAADRGDRFTITISDAYGASSTTTVDVTVLGAAGGSPSGGTDNGGGTIDTGITDLNATIGWIPIVGTLYNAFMLINDLISTFTALAVGDVYGLSTWVSLIVIDIIGMIPIIGGPIAASLYQALPYPAAATPAASVGL